MEKMIVCCGGKMKLEELDRAFIHAWLHKEQCVKFSSTIMWLILQISACVSSFFSKDDSEDIALVWNVIEGKEIALENT